MACARLAAFPKQPAGRFAEAAAVVRDLCQALLLCGRADTRGPALALLPEALTTIKRQIGSGSSDVLQGMKTYSGLFSRGTLRAGALKTTQNVGRCLDQQEHGAGAQDALLVEILCATQV